MYDPLLASVGMGHLLFKASYGCAGTLFEVYL
jgi:hypothetical protein